MRRQRWMIPPKVSFAYAVATAAFGWPTTIPFNLAFNDINQIFWLPPDWWTDLFVRVGAALMGAYFGLMLGLAIMAVVMVVTEPKPYW